MKLQFEADFFAMLEKFPEPISRELLKSSRLEYFNVADVKPAVYLKAMDYLAAPEDKLAWLEACKPLFLHWRHFIEVADRLSGQAIADFLDKNTLSMKGGKCFSVFLIMAIIPPDCRLSFAEKQISFLLTYDQGSGWNYYPDLDKREHILYLLETLKPEERLLFIKKFYDMELKQQGSDWMHVNIDILDYLPPDDKVELSVFIIRHFWQSSRFDASRHLDSIFKKVSFEQWQAIANRLDPENYHHAQWSESRVEMMALLPPDKRLAFALPWIREPITDKGRQKAVSLMLPEDRLPIVDIFCQQEVAMLDKVVNIFFLGHPENLPELLLLKGKLYSEQLVECIALLSEHQRITLAKKYSIYLKDYAEPVLNVLPAPDKAILEAYWSGLKGLGEDSVHDVIFPLLEAIGLYARVHLKDRPCPDGKIQKTVSQSILYQKKCSRILRHSMLFASKCEASFFSATMPAHFDQTGPTASNERHPHPWSPYP